MKIMKRLGIVIALNLMLLSPSLQAFSAYIPAKTLEIAREAELRQIAAMPSSEVIRVGIGTNGFKTWVYKNVDIFGTAKILICDGDMVVADFPANTNLTFKLEADGTVTVSEQDETIVARVSNTVRVLCPDGLLGVKGLMRSGKQALYHGAFELVKTNNGYFNLVNLIEVEDYLKGVVPNEMPVHFGLEALKAQSVAARNYVLSPRVKASPNYDVVDSVASQVYFGANTERPLSNQAVNETEGIVALYDWNLILAQYSSTAGGYTESFGNAFSDPTTKEFPSKDKPYLKAKPDILSQPPLNTEEAAAAYYKSKPDSYDVRSSYFRWTREWNADELKKILESTLASQSATGFVKPVFNKGDKLGNILELKVLRRGESGKIIEMEVITDNNTYKVYKELVVRRLITKDGKALPSANVVFENTKDENGNLVSVKAFGGGFGHGVGMSQYGAGFMATELKLPFTKILKHYYSGISLTTKPVIISTEGTQISVTQSFYAPQKKAKIILDNKFGVNTLKAVINGKEELFELPRELLGHKRFVEIDISKYIKQGKNTVTFGSPEFEGSAFKKALRLYVELVEKDDKSDIW